VAEEARKVDMPDSQTDNPSIGRRPFHRSVVMLIYAMGGFATLYFIIACWNWYARNRTTAVRTVRQEMVYMRDGTVWRVYGSVYALPGDRVRYQSLGDGETRCILVDTTTGWSRAAFRVSGPFGHTSCPAATAATRIMNAAGRLWRHDRRMSVSSLLHQQKPIIASPDEIEDVPRAKPNR
jgi:hypothetical protein